MDFDFYNAQPPRLSPLENSYVENTVEADLKRLFIDMVSQTMAIALFDANVLGAAHLGSFELVRKSVNADGLSLLPGDKEESSTRFLYRAWRSRNVQGRGLHFLRTYLQVLFPNINEITQLWHSKSSVYPTDLRNYESPDAFLTSRILITINMFPTLESVRLVENVLANVIPARFVIAQRYLATSSIGKIRPAMFGCAIHNFQSHGTLKTNFYLQSETQFISLGIAHGAQNMRSQGGVA